MKKLCFAIVVALLMSINLPVFSMSVEKSLEEGLRDCRVQPDLPADAPLWIEYVPVKYQNPRTDFSKGKAIAELSVGIVLTDLLITSPIGIPMICHSTTKLKNIGYADKKEKFFYGLEYANSIQNDAERQLYYTKLLSKCKFKKKKGLN